MNRSDRSLKIILCCVASLAGLIQAWAKRFYIEPDGLNYLDISSAYLRHDWHNAVNAYWSPLYSWLLAAVFWVTRPSPFQESTLLHLLNFSIYLFALGCFGIFLRELITIRRANLLNFGGSKEAWLILGYTIFMYATLLLIGVGTDTPDMLVCAIFFLATAILIRLRRQESSWLHYGTLGAVLAVGYLAKAVMFPLAFFFLFGSLFAQGNWRRGVPGTLAAVAIFFAIGGPWVVCLSHAKGRLTYGDAGRLNYAYYVNGLASLPHWHGEIAGAGLPIHPTRRINDVPAVDEFAAPVAGTYPPWYDSSYWDEGVRPHFALKWQLHILRVNAREYLRLLSSERSIVVGLLVLSLFAGKARWLAQNLLALWTVWLAPLATFLLYALVHVETRFLGAPVVIAWCCALLVVPLPESEMSTRLWRCVALATAISLGLSVVKETGSDLASIRNSEHIEWRVACELQQLGLRAGDKVAVLGHTNAADYWARLAQVQVVADLPEQEVGSYWNSSPEARSRVVASLQRTGAKFAVTNFRPPASQLAGWLGLGGTGYYALPLVNASQLQ